MALFKGGKPGWLTNVFEPAVDFYALLKEQAARTLAGIEALDAWIREDGEERAQRVRDLEREADELKLELQRRLVDSFVTPIDREDIYDLSVRMDEIINAAKATVREAEALDVSMDGPYMREMSAVLVEGTRCLFLSFSALHEDAREAANQAFLCRKSENRFTKVYRQAMRELFMEDDLKAILRTREVYRHLLVTAEKLDVVGEKLLHVIVKIS